jgi:hypothetical protein
VIDQSQTVLSNFESATGIENDEHYGRRDSARFTRTGHLQSDPPTMARLAYLMAHLEALSMTLSVLLQTLYTAQSVTWSRYVNLNYPKIWFFLTIVSRSVPFRLLVAADFNQIFEDYKDVTDKMQATSHSVTTTGDTSCYQ